MDKLFTPFRIHYLGGLTAITEEPIDICALPFSVTPRHEWSVTPDTFEMGDQCDQLHIDFLLGGFFEQGVQFLGWAFQENDAIPWGLVAISFIYSGNFIMPTGLIPQAKVQQDEFGGFPSKTGRQEDECLAVLGGEWTFAAPS